MEPCKPIYIKWKPGSGYIFGTQKQLRISHENTLFLLEPVLFPVGLREPRPAGGNSDTSHTSFELPFSTTAIPQVCCGAVLTLRVESPRGGRRRTPPPPLRKPLTAGARGRPTANGGPPGPPKCPSGAAPRPKCPKCHLGSKTIRIRQVLS